MPEPKKIKGHRLPASTMFEESVKTKDGNLEVVVVKPGFNFTDDHYYPADVLAAAVPLYEGAKMFINHDTATQKEERPEGDLRNWVAVLEEVKVGPDGEIRGIARIIDRDFQAKVEMLESKNLLHTLGVSHRALGEVSFQTIEGKETILAESIRMVRSVDFVTEAGAGGQAELLEAKEVESDIDLIDMDRLRKRRPDLVLAIQLEERGSPILKKGIGMEPQDVINQLKEDVKKLTVELEESKNATATKVLEELRETNKKLTEQLEESKKEEAKAKVRRGAQKLIDDSDLPDTSKKHLQVRFEEATSMEDVQKAIDAESKYLEDLSESGVVKGLGDSEPTENVEAEEKDRKELQESFQAGFELKGYSEEDSKSMARTAMADL